MAPLDKKLQEVEWGEYKLGDLFEVQTVKSFDEGKLSLVEQKQSGLIEFVGRTRTDNGIKGYVEKLEVEPNPENVISVSQIGTVVAQLRKEKWYASQNIFSLTPKENCEKLISLFGVSAVNKSLCGSFSDGYSNYPTLVKLNEMEIQLPTKNGEIDFAFMESFIAELEAERIAELEAERIAELEAYLVATGLKDYVLTAEEERALADFESGKFEWGEFRIGELFDVRKGKRLPERVLVDTQGDIALINQSTQNNMFSRYSGLQGDNEIYKKNAITFGVNTKGFGYQTSDFYTIADVLFLKSDFLNEKNASYFIPTIKKQLPPEGWDKIFGLAQMKDLCIKIPTQNATPNYEESRERLQSFPTEEPDFVLMETFISAIQKLVIKDVVQYAERKIAATREVVE